MTSIANRPPPPFRPEAGKVSQEQLNKIPCPNLRTLVNEGWIKIDKDGLADVGNIDEAFKRLGLSSLPRQALVKGGESATAAAVQEQFGHMVSGKINLFRLTGSVIDHAGDTQVLRGGAPNKARLEWMLGFANKDGRFGKAEIAELQRSAATSEPATLRDRAIGVAELTAIFQVYGTKDASGKKSLSKEGVTDLWQNSRFPEEWRAQLKSDGVGGVTNANQTTTLSLIAGVVGMAFRQIGTAAGRALMGIDMATGRDPQLNQTWAMSLSQSCPAGPPTAASKKDVDASHQAKLG